MSGDDNCRMTGSSGKSDYERFIGPDKRRVRLPRGLAAVVALIALVLGAGLIVLYPRDQVQIDRTFFGFVDGVESAEVADIREMPCDFDPAVVCTRVSFSYQPEGSLEPEFHLQDFTSDIGASTFEIGDRVFLGFTEGEDGSKTYNYYDRDRLWVLGLVGLVFAAAVIGLGRLRGVAALAGLVISLAVLFWFIVPAVIAGRDAVAVAVVGGGLIVLIALYLAHGYTPLTHVAAIGAFTALALTAVLSWLAIALAKFTGFASEESFYLAGLENLEIGGLLLAGIVLGAIGALDDVTVTQASAVWEVNRANPDLGRGELFASGLRVGRDHIASTVNTLLLAYAGAALPLLILFSLSGLPPGVVASSEVIAVEIVRTLVGSIGLVAAVPITTWLAARRLA
jgi:uncharacterized membrane protein